MKQVYPLIIFLFFIPLALFGQEKNTDKPFTMKFGGFVRYEAYFDDYKSIDTRDGNLTLYPERPVLDAEGNDINKTGQLEMASIQSRAKVTVSGPSAFGAKTSAFIETDFEGTSQDVVRTLRLRHAFLKLDWEKSSLMLGQYWHPLFVTENFPEVLSFGAALPIQPFSRAPQARFNYKPGKFKITAAAIIHGYNRTPGEYEAQRNSGLPEIQMQIKYSGDKIFAGATAGYTVLKPRLQTSLGYKTTETVGSYSTQAFFKFISRPFTFKSQIVYGENLSSYTMLGAYAVESGTRNMRDDYSYTNMETVAGWIEIMSDFPQFNYGFFAGYTQNLGFAEKPESTSGEYEIIDGRAADMASLLRISPRITYKSGSVVFGLEYMYNLAEYGEEFDDYYKSTETVSASHSRYLVSVTYAF